jgi:hypothetical protein
MKAYKYRSSKNISFAFDIILNNRLYCADYKSLNDPCEGSYILSYGDGENMSAAKLSKSVSQNLDGCRICSLSKSAQEHALWIHYANGFDGLAIELEIPDHSGLEVVYDDSPFGHLKFGYEDENRAHIRMLTRKWSDLRHEKEVRIIQSKEWYADAQVTCVILGFRMEPSLSEALKIVCASREIPIMRPIVTDIGIQLFSGPPHSAAN